MQLVVQPPRHMLGAFSGSRPTITPLPAITIAVDCELFRGSNRDKCAFLGMTLWKPDSRIADRQRGIRVQVVQAGDGDAFPLTIAR
jgi:hypothetical protein